MFTPRSTATFDAFRTTSEYTALVEKELLALANLFLGDEEVNEWLSDAEGLVRRRPAPTSVTTIAELVQNAGGAGFRLTRMGSPGTIRVPAERAESFLRVLLLPAALEVARLAFLVIHPEASRRALMTRELEDLKRTGNPAADSYELALEHGDPEILDEADATGFGPSIFGDLDATHSFEATDDDRRLDASRRAEAARTQLIAALGASENTTKEWSNAVASIDKKVRKMIREGFRARRNGSNNLTVAILEAVRHAFELVDETTTAVLHGYTDKIMDLAKLVKFRGGKHSTGSRVGKSIQRVDTPKPSKRKPSKRKA